MSSVNEWSPVMTDSDYNCPLSLINFYCWKCSENVFSQGKMNANTLRTDSSFFHERLIRSAWGEWAEVWKTCLMKTSSISNIYSREGQNQPGHCSQVGIWEQNLFGRWLFNTAEKDVMKFYTGKLKAEIRSIQSRIKNRFLAVKPSEGNTLFQGIITSNPHETNLIRCFHNINKELVKMF